MELGIEIETFNWGLTLRIITQEFELDQGQRFDNDKDIRIWTEDQ